MTTTPTVLVGDNVTVTATVSNESPAGTVIDLGAWPDASTTGVVAGTTLVPYTGPSVVTTAGTTIRDADVSGCLEIAADNVTVENSRITCGAGIGIWQYTGVNGLSIDHVDFIGTGTGAAAVYGIGSYTLTNSHIRGFVDGLKVDNDDTIVGNYIHDLVQTVNSHNDVIQSSGGSNTIIRGNRLEHTRSQTSAFIIKADLAPIDNYVIEENLLSGGAFNQYIAAGTMCCGGAFPEPTNMVVRNNVVMADTWLFGTVVAQGASQLGGTNTFECIVDDAGVPLELYWRDLQTAGIGPAPCSSLIGITGVAGSVGTATGVVVSDVLPDGLQYVGHNGSGSYDPVADLWTPSVVAPASTQTITIFAQAPSASTFTSTPEIIAVDQADTDSTPGNGDPTEDDQASLSITAAFPGNFPPTITSVGGPYSTAVGGPAVTLTGTATDPEGALGTLLWDLDGDGVFEAPDPAPFTPTATGPVTVTFQACDTATPIPNCVTESVVVTGTATSVCGPLSQEAEIGALTGAMASVVDSSTNGGAYLATPELSGNDYFGGVSPSTARYCMTVVTAGQYTLDAMITGNGGTSDSIWVQIDNGPLLNWALTSNGFTLDKAYNWGSADPAVFNLAIGDYDVKLSTREDGVFVDWLSLVPVGQTPSAPLVSNNIPPSISANGPYTTGVNIAVALVATVADVDGDSLTTSWDLDGDGVYETPEPATFTPSAAGVTNIAAQVCDGTVCRTSAATVIASDTPPTVVANGPYSAPFGTPIALAATAADPNGDSLTVTWDLDGDGTFESVDPVSFTPAAVGTATVTAQACDATVCVTDSTTVTATNTPPTVSANGPYPVAVGTPVALAATAADADGDAVTVLWDLDGDGTFETPDPASFTPAAAGTTTLTVEACDSTGACTIDATTVVATSAPTPPAPGCGPLSQEAEAGTLAGVMAITADGGASGGSVVGVPEGTKNDYSQATLSDYVEFCMVVATAGDYVIDAVVTGNGGTSDSFWVEVDGATPRALWSVPSVGLAQDFVSVQGGADPLVLQLAAGDHTIRVLLREDGTVLDTIALLAQGGPPPPPPPPVPGNPPTGSANGPYAATAGTPVTLTATAADADGDALTINWDLDGDGTFETADPATVTPTVVGTSTVTVQICSGGVCISRSTILTVSAAPVTPPAGCSASTTEAEAATLAGVFGIVPDGAASGGLAVEVPEGTKNDYSKAILADFVEFCMFAPIAGNYTVDAAATGAGPTSDSFWVSINGAPVVLWSIPSNGYTNDQVSEQSVADPVVWPLPAGPYTVRFYLREDGARLDRAGLAPTTAAATAPAPPATGPPPPTTNTPPTANAGGPYSAAQGTSIVLNGAGGDADGDPVTLSWDLDGDGVFESPNPATFAANTAGTFTIGLQVCDGAACTTDTATVAVSASCGGLTQEAENGTLFGDMVAFNDAGASGQRAVRTPQGTPRDYAGGQSPSYVEFCITVPISGLYRVDGRVRAPNGGSDSFWVQFDNTALPLWDLGPSSTYRTDSVSNRGGPDPVIWNIPAGDHTLRFFIREDGAVLDRFTLVPA